MCSISGVVSFVDGYEDYLYDPDFLKSLIICGEDRGRDSFGIGYPLSNLFRKYITKPSTTPFNLLPYEGIVFNNNRAEPTTEFIKHKKETDVQPFRYQGITIVHNGTIANDKELIAKYQLEGMESNIDSAVIPVVLHHLWDGYSEDQLITLLQHELVGSFALAIHDQRNPDVVWLAINYKPLSLIITKNALYFTSLEEYINNDTYSTDLNKKVVNVSPYTLLKINRFDEKSHIQSFSLYPKKEGRRALIIASGGLDSTVAATWAKKQGYEIELLHFQYGCKATKKETEQIKLIADYLECPLTFISADFFKNTIKHSRLFEENNLNLELNGEKSAELAHEWVPARNLIFMSIAAGYAEANQFDFIVLGGNLEESGCLTPNNPENKVWKYFSDTKEFSPVLPSSVQVGDGLLGLNGITFVQEIYTQNHKKIVLPRIRCGDKIHTLECSPEHPFVLADLTYRRGDELRSGDQLYTINGNAEVLGVHMLERKELGFDTVNFHCHPDNHFAVGEGMIMTHNSYSDNEYIFQKKFNDLLPNSLNLNCRVQVLTPVANLMKHEIVKMGLELGSPLHLTWSCYSGETQPCGTCGPDYMRKMAFLMNGIEDMQKAEHIDPSFWEGCKKVMLIDKKWVECHHESI